MGSYLPSATARVPVDDPSTKSTRLESSVVNPEIAFGPYRVRDDSPSFRLENGEGARGDATAIMLKDDVAR